MARRRSTASTTSIVATKTSRRSCRAWARRSAAWPDPERKSPANAGAFRSTAGSAHRCQLQVHLILAILALQDARRHGEAVDDPDHGLLVAIVAGELGRLLRLAFDGHRFLAGDLVGHLLGAPVVDHAIAQWLAGGGVARDRQVHQHRVKVARLQRDGAAALGLDVAAPTRLALVPVVCRVLVDVLDQQHRRIGARQWSPLAIVVLENRALA